MLGLRRRLGERRRLGHQLASRVVRAIEGAEGDQREREGGDVEEPACAQRAAQAGDALAHGGGRRSASRATSARGSPSASRNSQSRVSCVRVSRAWPMSVRSASRAS